MNLLRRLTTIGPETPVRARKVCLILGFGMFYGLLTGMGIGLVLDEAGVATAKRYFLISMAIAGTLGTTGVARVVCTATARRWSAIFWRFAVGWAGAVVPLLITIFMGRQIRYGFLIGAIAGLILTVGFLRTLPDEE